MSTAHFVIVASDRELVAIRKLVERATPNDPDAAVCRPAVDRARAWSNDLSGPNIQCVLDVSTAHLTEQERTWLEAGELPGQLFSGEYGGLVYPNVEGEPPDGMSETLWAICRHAADRGCGYILFDRDAPALPDFTVLEEA